MQLPDFKAIHSQSPLSKRLAIAALVAAILIVFGFAFFINIPEWR
jgi:hypothetical protein